MTKLSVSEVKLYLGFVSSMSSVALTLVQKDKLPLVHKGLSFVSEVANADVTAEFVALVVNAFNGTDKLVGAKLVSTTGVV